MERISAQLAQIDRELPELAGCEDALSAALTEKLGYAPCPEEAALMEALETVLKDGALLQEAGEALDDALHTAQTWLGANPIIIGVSGGLQKAEAAAQVRLNAYLPQLEALQQKLAALGYSLDVSEFQFSWKDYLLDLFTDTLIDNRCDKVQKAVMRMGWQWKALLPQLDNQFRRARITWMNALCRTDRA